MKNTRLLYKYRKTLILKVNESKLYRVTLRIPDLEGKMMKRMMVRGKKGNVNTTIFSLILILAFFGIRMMLPNSMVSENEIIDIEDFQSVLVTKVIDGDTIWVEIEGVEEKVRFIGVNTPEKEEPGFSQATDFTRAKLLNRYIFLEKDVSDKDKYNRLLRYIWLEIPEDSSDGEKQIKLFNGMLVREGYAEIVVYKPDVKYLDYYQRVGQE